MKAKEAKLLDLLRTAPQLIIPIYQRLYSWGRDECEQLWDDIMRCGRDDDNNGHFIGSVVYIEHGLYSVTSQSPLLIIDGQQRITTVSLLIAALAEAVGEEELLEGFSQAQLRGFYLTNPLLSGEKRYKLVLSQTDNASLRAIVDGKKQPEECSLRVTENFKFFQDKLANKALLETVCKGLSKLIVVDISLQRGYDNPQLIFESMNSTGKRLSQADLIRNYILMGLDNERQTELYNDHWRQMELLFGQEAYSEQFDAFMRHYLTVKTGDIPKIDGVYNAFKLYFRRSQQQVETLVADIHQFAGYFCAIALGKEKESKLKDVFQDIRELRMDVSYPLILEMYDDFKHGVLQHADFVEALRLLESYVFRRAVCAIPTNSLNKTFASMNKSINKDRYVESMKALLSLLPSYRRFPNDAEFKREISSRDLYNFRSRSYWLKRLENFGRKERIVMDEHTIEHILPQSDNNIDKVPQVWRQSLGDEWERVWETWRHTLGNLTLTRYNSEYSNKPFAEKRDMEGGFKHSPLRLNEGLGSLDSWDETMIQQRAAKLAEKACQVWPSAVLPAGLLDNYKVRASGGGTYGYDDHPNLAKEGVKDLFDALRKAILALDACVTEVFLKRYIAYKAEVNFVDVVPKSKHLCLYLNIPFAEIDDPRGICKDVTHLGHWGNGDVETALETLDDLPHVMALISQAFERQVED